MPAAEQESSRVGYDRVEWEVQDGTRRAKRAKGNVNDTMSRRGDGTGDFLERGFF